MDKLYVGQKVLILFREELGPFTVVAVVPDDDMQHPMAFVVDANGQGEWCEGFELLAFDKS